MQNDENIPYRTGVEGMGPAVDKRFSQDEAEFSTLESVEKTLKEAMTNLTHVDVMDLTQSELKVKQQIKAHQLALGILEPIYESIVAALQLVNDKYKQR